MLPVKKPDKNRTKYHVTVITPCFRSVKRTSHPYGFRTPVADWSLLVNCPCPLSCGPKWDEVTGEWRKLHIEELNDLYSLLNIIRLIKSRRMRWAGHVARIGGRGAYTGFWWGNLRERDHLGDPGIDERIILR